MHKSLLRATVTLATVAAFSAGTITVSDAASSSGPVDSSSISGDYVGIAPPKAGEDFDKTPYALQNKANVDAQLKLFDLYAKKQQVLAAGGDISNLNSKIKSAQQSVAQQSGKPIAEIAPESSLISNKAAASRSSSMAAQQLAASYLGASQVGQQKNNWCGPATGYVILKYRGKTSKGGVALSQTSLAGSGYMRTGTGSTDWGDGDMARGLNNWGGLGYVQINHPSTSSLKQILISKIDAGRPPAFGTAEYANGSHYNFHPSSKNVYHWITGNGYYQFGDAVEYLDSATTVWPNTTPKRSMQVRSMSSFIASYGVVG